ncbi:MAG: hypothetical protein ACKO37_08175 [Vampirovibrionales bacterium]
MFSLSNVPILGGSLGCTRLSDTLRQKLLCVTAVMQLVVVLLPSVQIHLLPDYEALVKASRVFALSPIHLLTNMPFQFSLMLWGAVLGLALVFACYQWIEPQCRTHTLHRRVGPWLIWTQASLSLWTLTTFFLMHYHLFHIPKLICAVFLAGCLLLSWLASFIALIITGRWVTDKQQEMSMPETWLLVPYLGIQSGWLSLMVFVHACAFFRSTWQTFWSVPSIFGIGTLLFFFVALVLLLGYVEGFKSLQRWYAGTLAYGTFALVLTSVASHMWFPSFTWGLLCLVCTYFAFKPIKLKHAV